MKKAYKTNISISSILFVVLSLVPLFGMVLYPNIAFVMAYGLALLWILLTRRETQGGLGLLWGVEVEPAPSDILFIWVWVKRFLAGKLRWPSCLSLHLLLAFVLFNVLQIAISGSLNRGVWFAGATAYVISLAFLFSNIPHSTAWSETKHAFLLGVWITAAIVLLLALLATAGWNGHLANLYYANRPKGFFKDPNVTGAFIVPGVLFALSKLFFLKERFISFTGALLAISLSAVMLTFSRGALVNIAAGVLVIGVVALWARKGIKLAISIIVIGPFLAVFPHVAKAFGQLYRFQGLQRYDLFGRFAAWQAGLLLARDHPWGVGPGQFEIYSSRYEAMLPGHISITPSAHNLYLRVLAENGILGLIMLLLALGFLLWVLARCLRITLKKRNRELFTDGTWLASTFVGILAESFVIDTLHWRHFWILIGFIVAYRQLVRQASPSQ